MHPDGTERSIYITNKKIGVLEIEEQAHVDADGKCEQEFSLVDLRLLHHGAHHVKIDAGEQEQNKNKTGSSPAVKEKTEHEYDRVLVFITGQVIGKKEKRKKIEKESDAAEDHVSE
jgi:hypothetical protein